MAECYYWRAGPAEISASGGSSNKRTHQIDPEATLAPEFVEWLVTAYDTPTICSALEIVACVRTRRMDSGVAAKFSL